MRIMSITQQNLNTRPCVQNNQPNFKGLFVRENPIALEKLFPKGSVGAKALDVFELIINKGTSKHLRVTVSPLQKNEVEKIILLKNGLPNGRAETNLKVVVDDINPDAEYEDLGITHEYLGEQKDLDSNLRGLMQKILDDFGYYVNWQGIAEALKSVKP